MNTLKKIFLSFILTITLVAPQIVFAINLGNDYTERARVNAGFAQAGQTTASETVGAVIKSALSLVGTIFLALTVYAGFLWMTAQGDDSKIEKAQNIIRSCVIGLIITLSAYGITNFVVSKVVEKTVAP